MSSDWPPNGEAWVPFLKRTGRFTELMILAWQSVEDLVGQMMYQEFELIPLGGPVEDPRIEMLRDIPFWKKLDFLRIMGRFSSSDIAAIRKFSEERNKLFHGNVFTSPHPIAMPQFEKNRLMELASRASQITTNRGFGVWFDESTEDMGNKDTPRPEKPLGIKRTEELKKVLTAKRVIPEQS